MCIRDSSLSNGDILKFIGNFDVAKGQLLFDGTLPVDIEKLKVKAQDLQIDVIGGRAALNPWLEAWIKGHIDLASAKGGFTADILKARFEAAGIPLIQTARQKIKADLTFKNGVLFRFPQMDSSLQYRSGGQIDLKIESIGKWHPFFATALKGLERGHADFHYRGDRWEFQSALFYRNRILLHRGKPVERFDIDGRGEKGKMRISINRDILIDRINQTTTLRYSDLQLDLGTLLDDWKKVKINSSSPRRIKKSKNRIEIHSARSEILYGNVTLPYDRLELGIDTVPLRADLRAEIGAGTLRGIYRNNRIDAEGKNLPDRFIHGIPAFKNLQGGYYAFTARGEPKHFKGVFSLQDAVWGQSAAYNNILATINSIPSMLEQENPGFNSRGFKIKKGAITYRFDDPILHFDDIMIHGAAANIFGKGSIDFTKRWIDIRMRIQFLQTVSKTLKHIPVAGYILFGKDGTVSVGLNVQGPLNNPHVKTTAVKDIATAPLNILQRTITLPFHLFE